MKKNNKPWYVFEKHFHKFSIHTFFVPSNAEDFGKKNLRISIHTRYLHLLLTFKKNISRQGSKFSGARG